MGELRTGEVKAFTIKAGTELPVSNLGVSSARSSAQILHAPVGEGALHGLGV